MMTLSRMRSTMTARKYSNSMLYTLLVTMLLPTLSLAAPVKTAIIVGAGPSGLATALVLAKRHGYQVTIIESQERTDVYDPTKAYPFLIRERGQKLTKLFPDVQADLESKGILTAESARIISIPADPNEAFDPTPKTIPTFVTPHSDYWLRRHEFIRVLLDGVSREASIQLITGVQCESIQPVSESLVQVTTLTDTKEIKSYSASLVVAADGMRSQVRETLHRSPSVFPSWNNNNPHGFRIRKWMSPSSGLQFKTLHMNADAGVPMGNGTMYQIPFDTPVFHVIRSVFTKPNNAISLGLLPAKPAPTRTFNVIRVPSHDIWNIRDGQKLRAWFQKAFPRFDFSAESALVDQAEFDRFAETEGLKLPPCQYCPELYISSPTQEAGVVLVGDSVHTFPPDLGEGVNSGLEDVVVLDKCLKKHDTVGEAIAEYASMRGPESKALVKMVRVGAPFQYQQFGGILTVKKFLWTANFFGRVLLHKATMKLMPLPVFIQISDPNLKYSTALRRADVLTVSLWAIFAAFFIKSLGLVSRVKGLVGV